MIDSHLHLNRSEFDADRSVVVERAVQAGVSAFLNIGYDPRTCAESVALAEADPRFWATVGIHPHDAGLLADANGSPTPAAAGLLADLEAWARRPRVVAIGEIGLDFYRDLSPRAAQDTAFSLQLDLAKLVDLPVVLHVRDAWTETLAQLDREGVPARGGVLHSFSAGLQEVAWAKANGFLIGIGGPVTYKNSRVPEAVVAAGLDLLLLETDAPWLPPVPHRGRRNEPAYLERTCARVAEVLGVDADEVAAATTRNFHRLFLSGTRDA